MELRHLRYFVALAEQLNFTRAAEDVHVTQSTLSHQIRSLELELGVTLFMRAGRRVSLTLSGRNFLTTAARALREIDDGVITLKEANTEVSGTLNIGSSHTLNLRVTPESVSRFLSGNPAVQVRVEELPAQQVMERVAREQVDVGISYAPVDARTFPDLYFEPLYREEVVLAVPEGHPFADRRRVRMCELHRQKMMLPTREVGTRGALEEYFRIAGAEPIIVAEFNTMAFGLELARRLKVLVMTSEHIVNATPGLTAVPIESPKPIRTPALIWKHGRRHPAVAKLFADIVKATAAELTVGHRTARANCPERRNVITARALPVAIAIPALTRTLVGSGVGRESVCDQA
jgi:LysR family cyn operon transcriptional activator